MSKPPQKVEAPDLLMMVARAQVGFTLIQRATEFQATDRREFIRGLMVEATYHALKGQQEATQTINVMSAPSQPLLTLTLPEMALVDTTEEIKRLRQNIVALYRESEAGRLDLATYLDGEVYD